MRLKMGLLSGLMLSMMLMGSCGNNADDVTDPPPTMDMQTCDMPAMMKPNIILVPINEVKKWDGHGDETGLCRPPNEIDGIFHLFCQSKGYKEMRYGESDGTCMGGIVQDFALYKNVICFSPILNQ